MFPATSFLTAVMNVPWPKSGPLRPLEGSVLPMVWNEVMAAVQELPSKFMSGVAAARPALLCMDA